MTRGFPSVQRHGGKRIDEVVLEALSFVPTSGQTEQAEWSAAAEFHLRWVALPFSLVILAAVAAGIPWPLPSFPAVAAEMLPEHHPGTVVPAVAVCLAAPSAVVGYQAAADPSTDQQREVAVEAHQFASHLGQQRQQQHTVENECVACAPVPVFVAIQLPVVRVRELLARPFFGLPGLYDLS